MKQSIKLTNSQKDMSLIAMNNYRKTLDGLGKKLFDIAFKKVQQMHGEVELDGMEIIYIAQSLRYQGKQFSQSNKREIANLYREFGDQIELIRIAFQRKNNPLLKIKKAASAGTLTA